MCKRAIEAEVLSAAFLSPLLADQFRSFKRDR